MFLGAKKPPTKTVKVAVKKDQKNPQTDAKGLKNKSSQAPLRKTGSGQNLAVRRVASPASSVASASKSQQFNNLAPPQRNLKRKLGSPAFQQFSSDSDSNEEDAEVLSNKRPRSSSETAVDNTTDYKRQPFKVEAVEDIDDKNELILRCADVIDEYYKDYKSAFDDVTDTPMIKLQFPSNYRSERYKLLIPKESRKYEPISDVVATIDMICKHYLPEGYVTKQLEGLAPAGNTADLNFKLVSAARQRSAQKFTEAVELFNRILKGAMVDGVVASTITDQKSIDIKLVECILNQIYWRTVLPDQKLLAKYENGTSEIYGEILPIFGHEIFKLTGLRSDHVFIDLGSGVGNLALQAALEFGCESWGIEQMKNPASLARKQVKEFNARCKRWSIKPGKVTLLEGDFLASPEIDAAIPRADVIVINNKAFLPELNAAIALKLLDAPEGCRIVSLKSFAPDNWELKSFRLHDTRNVLRSVKKQYWSRCVSWSDEGGDYYIATKDTSQLRKFDEQENSKRR
ncbi:DOT1-domain-containing protein [Microthyrium microscopicum]|uniref:Histone-lysine N-methyltransferase, H3 lysine-79 specific n=1 Tax=Microthyrium microscopicum TaxID=703497 RepID=A0A6A6TYM4_9PEZI|nr:DOT1-domain-containing protein [Microthyrium microscopicum]